MKMEPEEVVDKSQLRIQFKNQLAGLTSEERARQSRDLFDQLLPFFKEKKGVWGLYSPLSDEPNLMELLKLAPHVRWAFPKTLPDSQMQYFAVQNEQDLEANGWGLKEPSGQSPAISPENISGLIVPGLAFDKKGYRLGRGGGYYDRYLENFKGYKLGVAFSECLMLGALPRQPHDQPMNTVATPIEWVDMPFNEVNYGI